MDVSNVTIVDVSPRDGLQNEPLVLPVETRTSLVKRLAAAGVPRIEVGAFVHPRRVPQMANTAAVYAALPPTADGQRYTALIPNMRGYELAAEAGLPHVRLVLAASESLQKANFGREIAASVKDFEAIARQAHADGIPFGIAIGASFGCPFEGHVPPQRVIDLARQLADLGADELVLADTTGMAVPTQVLELGSRLRHIASREWPHLILGIHLHNTRNTGYANAYAALQAGITSLDASLGGIGGCPFAPRAVGNIATEDLVHMLNGMGVATGVNLAKLVETAAWLSTQMEKTLPSLVGKAEPVYPQLQPLRK